MKSKKTTPKKIEEPTTEEPKIDVWAIINDISHGKNNILNDENISLYEPWLINLAISQYFDCVDYANMMNSNYFLSSNIQYSFYINSIRPRKRYSKWGKKDKGKEADLQIIQKYYGYNLTKAEEALNLLTKDQLEIIRKRKYEGGLEK
jgi:hypothetical protein